MTRKRVGQGLHEAFSQACDACNGRGYHVRNEPVESRGGAGNGSGNRRGGAAKGGKEAAAKGKEAAAKGGKEAAAKGSKAATASTAGPEESGSPEVSPVAVEDPVEGAGARPDGAGPVQTAEQTEQPARGRRRAVSPITTL